MNKTIGAIVLVTSLGIGADYYAHSQETQTPQVSTNRIDKSSENGTYKSEFAPKYWIPGYGSLIAARNFTKGESAFHDTPRDWPTGDRAKRMALQLGWLFYQGITSVATIIAALKGISQLEKILK